MHKKITAKKSLLFFISVVDMNGRGRRDRTLGTRFWRPMLYQLSYTPVFSFFVFVAESELCKA